MIYPISSSWLTPTIFRDRAIAHDVAIDHGRVQDLNEQVATEDTSICILLDHQLTSLPAYQPIRPAAPRPIRPDPIPSRAPWLPLTRFSDHAIAHGVW